MKIIRIRQDSSINANHLELNITLILKQIFIYLLNIKTSLNIFWLLVNYSTICPLTKITKIKMN